jgi:hypothetical protein
MGIRFLCPSGHKLNVKTFLAGKRAICPECGAKVIVPDLPAESAAELPATGEIGSKPFAGSAGIGGGSQFDTASPSIVLEVAESAVAAPLAASGLPESVFAVAGPVLDAAEPVAATFETRLELRRDQTRRNQMVLLVVLAMVVIILAGVLIWVLKRNVADPESTGEESKSLSANEHAPILHVSAIADFTVHLEHAKPRA